MTVTGITTFILSAILFLSISVRGEEAQEPGANLPLMAQGLGGNKITPIKTGAELMALRMNLIDEAQKSIYLSTFSISTDQVGKDFFKVLCKKAKDGLDVRLIIDHRANKDYLDYSIKLKECGAYVIHFRPGSRFYAIHEKLLIIDGRKVITGGTGYTKTYKIHSFDSYRDETLAVNRVNHGWYDIDYEVQGVTACSMHYQFQVNFKRLAMMVADYNPDIWWYGWDNFVSMREKYYGLNKFAKCLGRMDDMKYGDSKAGGILGNPYVSSSRPILKAYLKAIDEAIVKQGKGAKQVIHLYAPYFVPGKKFVDALVKAQKAGVQVVVITNSFRSTDEGEYAKILFAAMVYATKELMKTKAEIRLWNEKSTLHRKGGVYGDISFFGSDNLDNRGQEYQSESVIYTDDVKIVDDMKNDYLRDMQHADVLTQEYINDTFKSIPAHHKWVAKHFKKYF